MKEKESAAKERFNLAKFIFGHEKLTKADAAEITIAVILAALLVFIFLKARAII